MNIFQFTKYIFIEMGAPISFKLRYFLEKVVKLFIIIINNNFKLSIPFLYFFSEDYTIKNSNGSWIIKNHSDHDYIINSCVGKELEPFFKIKKGLFIDVGAHIGKWSIFVAKQSNNSRVYAIEPNPETYSYLLKNVNLNGLKDKISCFNIAFSCRQSKLYFKAEKSNTATSRLSNERSSIKIIVTTLDSFIKQNKINIINIDTIKIDVEGHESEVLLGAKNTLKKLKKNTQIIVEISDKKKEILNLMQEMNFKIKQLETKNDYLFTKL